MRAPVVPAGIRLVATATLTASMPVSARCLAPLTYSRTAAKPMPARTTAATAAMRLRFMLDTSRCSVGRFVVPSADGSQALGVSADHGDDVGPEVGAAEAAVPGDDLRREVAVQAPLVARARVVAGKPGGGREPGQVVPGEHERGHPGDRVDRVLALAAVRVVERDQQRAA